MLHTPSPHYTPTLGAISAQPTLGDYTDGRDGEAYFPLLVGFSNMNSTDKCDLHFEETKQSSPAQIFLNSGRRKIFRMRKKVIKFGPGVDAREAQIMQYLKLATKAPLPDAVSDGPNTIMMDYVEGYNLQEHWPRMSNGQRQGIAEQIRNILRQLRGLKGNYISAVNRGPAVDMRKSTSRGGPFDSESEFNKFLLDKMISSIPFDILSIDIADDKKRSRDYMQP